jgi:hypothetical protein
MSEVIRGSVAQLAGRIVVNGVALGQPELSMLTRIGRGSFCKAVETIKKEGVRGKPTTVWEINTAAVLNFTFANANAAAAVAEGEATETEADVEAVAETATETVEVAAESVAAGEEFV